MKTKKLLVHLEEHNGEQEYRQHMLVEMDHDVDEVDIKEAADDIAKTWYDGGSYFEDGLYWFLGGTIAVRVTDIQEVSDLEYEILKKYNI